MANGPRGGDKVSKGVASIPPRFVPAAQQTGPGQGNHAPSGDQSRGMASIPPRVVPTTPPPAQGDKK